MLTSEQVGLVRDRAGVGAPRGLALHSRNQPKIEEVDAFIRAEAAKPFGWGATDCASTADRWVQLVRGISPMDELGRRHHDEAEARAWMAEFGGLSIAFNRAMRAAGMKKTKEPKPGDLGLVIYENRMCIAIHAGTFWFSRHEDGLVGAPLGNVWKAWAI